MKFSSVIAASASLFITLVAAQSLSDLPQCALTCSISGLQGTGCSSTDYACICKASSFITGISSCVQKACDAADQAKTVQFAVSFCAKAGVTLNVSSLTAAASVTLSTGTGSAAQATTTGSTVATTHVGSAVSSATVTQTSSSGAAAATSNAAMANGVSYGMGALVAAAAMGMAL